MDSIAAEKVIRPFVRETPLTESRALGAPTKSRVLLKLENLQETGSFKLRGAASKLLSMPREALARGIVVASTGNHAIATSTIGRQVADSRRHLCLRPIASGESAARSSPSVPVCTRSLATRCLRRSRPVARPMHRAARMSRPTTIPTSWRGRAPSRWRSCASSVTSASRKLDAIFVAVGGGGLIGGIGMHLKRESPDTEIVGCWPENSPALHECMRAGRFLDDFTDKPTYSTSTAGGVEPGAITLEIARRIIDRSILVTEAEILDATRRYFREEGQVIEGAAGVAVAAYLKNAAELRRQDRRNRHLRRQPRSFVRSPRQGLIGEKSRSWICRRPRGGEHQRAVEPPMLATPAEVAGVRARCRDRRSRVALADLRLERREFPRPMLGVAVEQEIHRELFAGRVDRARLVHRTGGAVGGRERFADRRLHAPRRGVLLRRVRPRHPRPRAKVPRKSGSPSRRCRCRGPAAAARVSRNRDNRRCG